MKSIRRITEVKTGGGRLRLEDGLYGVVRRSNDSLPNLGDCSAVNCRAASDGIIQRRKNRRLSVIPNFGEVRAPIRIFVGFDEKIQKSAYNVGRAKESMSCRADRIRGRRGEFKQILMIFLKSLKRRMETILTARSRKGWRNIIICPPTHASFGFRRRAESSRRTGSAVDGARKSQKGFPLLRNGRRRRKRRGSGNEGCFRPYVRIRIILAAVVIVVFVVVANSRCVRR